MEVFTKVKAPTLMEGLQKCVNMCQCKRRSFVGVSIIVPGKTHDFRWDELDKELQRFKENKKEEYFKQVCQGKFMNINLNFFLTRTVK